MQLLFYIGQVQNKILKTKKDVSLVQRVIMVLVVLALLVMVGCSETSEIPELDDVITAQLHLNAPKKNPDPFKINNPKNETVLLKIATWISQSQPIKGGTPHFYIRGIGPTTLTVKLRDGREIGIEPAYDCETKQLTNGGSERKCRHSEGHLILSNNKKRIRVTQPELDKWLIQGWTLDVRG